MLKVNTSIHTILSIERYSEPELIRRSVIPYLETNRLRPRLLAIQKTPSSYRCQGAGTGSSGYSYRCKQLGCLYPGMPAWPFRRQLRQPRRLRLTLVPGPSAAGNELIPMFLKEDWVLSPSVMYVQNGMARLIFYR
jgi:hypothetical protein